ncbi:hypothetical protein K461DRAFT_295190 [Myriangium duriaei CBS 260.36]|uniref:F-box domain-containing protein n=1 Tax=Myriangium duriaei CBS 260.36 TaxID=1168546 RepID=A0A9P4MEF3_9PEZI|nr:hypothetical protein K461DRAFT_295190 [Myriangium duriaei CBS 260.36]
MLGCLLQRLTLKHALPHRRHGDTKGLQTRADRLGKALNNLRLHSPHRRLDCLILTGEIIQTPRGVGLLPPPRTKKDWEPTWCSAECTFRVVCLALQTSSIPINELDVFGSVRRCRLAYDRISLALDNANITASVKKLKRLSLSVSSTMHAQSDNGSNSPAEDVCRLLQQCSELEALELHWYSLYIPRSEAQRRARCFFDHLEVQLPRLRVLSLKGIHTSDAGLLRFFAHTPLLQSLTMEGVELESGSFRAVFDYLTPRLEYLHIDDLHEQGPTERHLINFDASGKPHFLSSGPKSGPNHLTRQGKELRRRIRYRHTMGPGCSHPRFVSWISKQAAYYGPP